MTPTIRTITTTTIVTSITRQGYGGGHFKPFYAMTVHKAQGMTINDDYAIYEYDGMRHDMLYVALTRTSKEEYVNFCDIGPSPRPGARLELRPIEDSCIYIYIYIHTYVYVLFYNI